MRKRYAKTKDPLGYVTRGKQRRGRAVTWLQSLRSRAKKKGLPFNLEVEDLVVPKRCPVLGILLVFSEGTHSPKYNMPTVDRIDNAHGYTKDNIQIISWHANVLKSNLNYDDLKDLEAVLRYMKRHKKKGRLQ
jgi:hypothetical protein